MSQAVKDALTILAPTEFGESVEELLASAETEVDRARHQALSVVRSDREPLLRAIALLGGVVVAAYASANPARAFSDDEVREELFDASAIAERQRSHDPGSHPAGPALHMKLHQVFLELHRRNGRFQRLGDPQDMSEVTKGAMSMVGEIATAIDGSEGNVL